MLAWFDAKEASAAGVALAESFSRKPRPRGIDESGDHTALQELLRGADDHVRPLGLNFFKKAKFASSFKWRLIEGGVDPVLADSLTQSVIVHLSTPSKSGLINNSSS